MVIDATLSFYIQGTPEKFVRGDPKVRNVGSTNTRYVSFKAGIKIAGDRCLLS